MKIVLLHYRLIFRGGLETRLLNYIEQFHQWGHEVTIVCAKWDKTISLPSGVSVHRVNLGWMLKPFRAWYFDRKAQKLMAELSYDFALSLGRTACQDAVLMPGGHRGYLKALEKKGWLPGDWMQIHLDQQAYSSSQLIFAASSMMKSELVTQYQIDQEKIRLLFPPLNTEKYNTGLRPQRADLRRDLGISVEKIAFAFVSSSHFRKGLDLLLQVFAELDSEKYELLIIGMPAVKSNLKNVRYIGFWKELRQLYTAVDFTILPARYEPFGQVISESLQCGTPVMISHMVGAKDIVGPEEGLVIASLDPKIWVAQIQEFAHQAFPISSDFGKRKELTLAQHCKQMLQYWAERRV